VIIQGRFTVRYRLIRGIASDQTGRMSRGFGGGVMRVSAADRPGAYEAAVALLPRDRFPIFVATRADGAPLGFSAEEAQRIADQGLPLTHEAPPGDAIRIESVEPVVDTGGE
jgi:hypothetical protein